MRRFWWLKWHKLCICLELLVPIVLILEEFSFFSFFLLLSLSLFSPLPPPFKTETELRLHGLVESRIPSSYFTGILHLLSFPTQTFLPLGLWLRLRWLSDNPINTATRTGLRSRDIYNREYALNQSLLICLDSHSHLKLMELGTRLMGIRRYAETSWLSGKVYATHIQNGR